MSTTPTSPASLAGTRAVPSSLVDLYWQVRAMLRAYRRSAAITVPSLRIAEAEGVVRQVLDRNANGVDLDALPLWIASDRV